MLQAFMHQLTYRVIPLAGCLLLTSLIVSAVSATEVISSLVNFAPVGDVTLPAGATRLFPLSGNRLGVVVSGSQGMVAVVSGNNVRVLVQGDIGCAACATDGKIWYTQHAELHALDPATARVPRSLSPQLTSLMGAVVGERFSIDRLGIFYGEKFPYRVTPEARKLTALPIAESPECCPMPEITDQHGNQWALVEDAQGTTAVTLLTPTATAWKTFGPNAHLSAAHWSWLITDRYGFIWVAGSSGVARFDPRKPENGWFTFPKTDTYPAGEVTAMTLSPDGQALVAIRGGMYALDCRANGTPIVRPLLTMGLPTGPITALYCDELGRIWALAGGRLYRCEAMHDAWQRTWQALAPMPYSDHDIFSALCDGKVYIPGGAAYHSCPAALTNFDNLLIYDIHADRWEAEPMPHTRCYCGVAALNGVIWVVGGYTLTVEGQQQLVREVDCYNPRARTWRPAPVLPAGRKESIVTAVHGRIYVIGGVDGETPVRDVISIAPGETNWQKETPTPVTVRQCGGCALDGKIYIMVGGEGLLAYDTDTRQWQLDLPILPGKQPPRAAAVAAYQGEVWVLGGIDTDKQLACWRYNPRKKSWQPGPDLPHGRNWFDAIDAGGTLLLFGGAFYSKTHDNFIFCDTAYRLRTKNRLTTGRGEAALQ